MNKDNVLNVLLQTEEKHERFLAAWKRGVEFLGPELFGPKTVATAKDKNDLRPLREPVEAVFEQESGGEEQFLAALVSFYDPIWGEQLAKRINCPNSVCGLTYNLDHACTAILCELLLNYEGW
ncbi:MAG: hypothetical protein A2X84_05245 [Desulfuromonadaceae bacterium GWC2_58_13]|nr:MAG: hypothetical protein A2X84_05245 [Desulfuromonadaceae bacterium GWC2_58_13]